ncbi:uncharacterized protein LOC142765000 [Rhipicephalus microplus]|uniref:uncharacterized protein LOC142765000 n=1 Tax=Rhipicephalus microplus TaxID=6941 RepID=UPI003F6B2903
MCFTTKKCITQLCCASVLPKVNMSQGWLGFFMVFTVVPCVFMKYRDPTCKIRCCRTTVPSCLHLTKGGCKCGCAPVNQPCAPWNHTKCRPLGRYPDCRLQKSECNCYCF